MTKAAAGIPGQTNPFTGRRMAIILVSFFGVVVAVNVAMARLATGTFGGVVVENSYVASQHFNRWLDEAEAGRALGWRAVASRLPDGRVAVAVTGTQSPALMIAGNAWHPLGRLPDRPLVFVPAGTGRFVSREALPDGRWRVRLTLRDGGSQLRTQQDIP